MTNAPRVNITPVERMERIIVGGVGAAADVMLLSRGSAAVTFVLAVVLALAGADLVITGASGHCPLYSALGHLPQSLKAGTR